MPKGKGKVKALSKQDWSCPLSNGQQDPEFVDAFTNYVLGHRKKAYTTCENVIRIYCEHIRDAIVAKDELPDTENVHKRIPSKPGPCKYCSKENCKAIRAPIEMTRWNCLFSFIQYKMIEEREVDMMTKKSIRNVIICLKNAIQLIGVNKLEHLPEFIYLRQESMLKCAILYCDYLKLPWSARVFLKKLENREKIEDEQDKLITEYEEIVERKCMVWYLLRRQN